MARTPEGKVKDAVVKILKDYDAYYFFPVMNGYGRSGIPDIIVCFNGYFIAIECKAGDNKPTTLQARELDAISSRGGKTLVLYENTVGNLKLLLTALGDKQ